MNTRAKTSVVQSLAVGQLSSGFPNRVLNMSLFHMKITEASKSWPSGDTLYSVVNLFEIQYVFRMQCPFQWRSYDLAVKGRNPDKFRRNLGMLC